MTRHETFPADTAADLAAPDLAAKDMVLATDLDGTFLGGTEADRRQFYGWLQANRNRVGLVFVTGRDPGFIVREVRRGLPAPDYVIGDVGTTIARFDGGLVAPVAELEAEIIEAWGPASHTVPSALARVRGLKQQSTGFRHRVSYDMDPDAFDERALDIVAEMGLDALISDNRFFDVLPKGISKGPSLLRLLTHLGVENARTLVAGDTLNDLSMLELGLPAVAVGGSEPALIARVQEMDHIHCAQGVGVAGIAEAILKFGLLSPSKS